MTTFIEDPRDYLGETVTAEPRHGITEEVTFAVCGKDGCLAVVPSDEAHRGDVHGDEYAPKHRWNVRRHRQAPWGTA